MNNTHGSVTKTSALKLSKKGLGSESNIADAKAQFYQAKAQLKQAWLNFDNTTIRAPYDGIINKISQIMDIFPNIQVSI